MKIWPRYYISKYTSCRHEVVHAPEEGHPGAAHVLQQPGQSTARALAGVMAPAWSHRMGSGLGTAHLEPQAGALQELTMSQKPQRGSS